MKLCFSTLGCADRSLEDIISIAKKHNISAIEIRGINGIMNNADITEFAQANSAKTAELLSENGILPIVLGTSCYFHNMDKFDKAINEGELSVKIAENLNIPNIRVFGDKIQSPECIDRVVSGLSQLCKCSDRVNILLEVHGDFNTAETLSQVTEKMSDTKNFGLIWDIEHTHKAYGNSWSEFYSFARPYIKHVHIKDFSEESNRLCLIGNGSIPIVPIVERLLSDGYDGYFSLEWEKKWHPELPDIELALDSFVSAMKEVRRDER